MSHKNSFLLTKRKSISQSLADPGPGNGFSFHNDSVNKHFTGNYVNTTIYKLQEVEIYFMLS